MSRGLYPRTAPARHGRLDVSGGHQVYWEECGAHGGLPAVALHGGPGAGTNPGMRRFFHPKRWRVTLFDQRGCGRSTPLGALEHNTTQDLIADIEALRAARGVERWMVFGGSWGSTLALAYAQAHPQRVTGLVLRGVFLMSPAEIDWFYRGGAGVLLPEAWEAFLAPLQPDERGDPVAAYKARLTDADARVRSAAALAWTGWESAAIRAAYALHDIAEPDASAPAADPTRPTAEAVASASGRLEALARIECHYCYRRGFFPEGFDLLEAARGLPTLPVHIVQGRFDLVTPPRQAWRLAQALPHAHLSLVRAGHSAFEPPIIDGLVRATDALAAELNG